MPSQAGSALGAISPPAGAVPVNFTTPWMVLCPAGAGGAFTSVGGASGVLAGLEGVAAGGVGAGPSFVQAGRDTSPAAPIRARLKVRSFMEDLLGEQG